MKPRNFVSGDGKDRVELTNVEGRRRALHRRPVVWLLASAMAVLGAVDELSAERLKSSASSADRHKPASGSSAEHSKTASTSSAEHHKSSSHHKKSADSEHHKDAEHRKEAEHHKGAEHHRHVNSQPEDGDGAAMPLPPDLAAAKEANELVHQGKVKEATALAASIGDPVAAKLVEWAILRHSDSPAGFERYLAFMRANPDWPSMPLLRRRAEARLWQERRDGATVRRFVGK